MPITLTGPADAGGQFQARAWGKVTESESLELFADIGGHPNFAPGSTLLVDAREVTGTPDAEELRNIADAMQTLTDRGFSGVAIVTAAGFVYGMARMFTTFAEIAGSKVSAFRDLEEAREWLLENASSGAS